MDSLSSGPSDYIPHPTGWTNTGKVLPRRDLIGQAAFWLCPWDRNTFPGHWRYICQLWGRPYSTIKGWRRGTYLAPVEALETIAATLRAEAAEELRLADLIDAEAVKNAAAFAKVPIPLWRARRIAAAHKRKGAPVPRYAQTVLDAHALARERPIR